VLIDYPSENEELEILRRDRAAHLNPSSGRQDSGVDVATVLDDPTRTGLPAEVTQALCDGRPSRVIYVSCDAATFARDLRQMLTAGWHLTHLEGFDMFPQSAHLETLAVLDR
jgi:tRNA/tmRNA/rRNA uracil-C5-methylase (TrmA/RlmC/RlmD family)